MELIWELSQAGIDTGINLLIKQIPAHGGHTKYFVCNSDNNYPNYMGALVRIGIMRVALKRMGAL